MVRKVVDLGEMKDAKGVVARWIDVSADSEAELEEAINLAKLKGWEPDPMIRGHCPQTGRVKVWMRKM
jgi:hypothetical protein